MALAVLGCSKEEPLPPVVEFLWPPESFYMDAGDTLKVRAKVTSHKALQSVELFLLSADGLPVGQRVIRHPETMDYTLEIDYPLAVVEPETGSYRFCVMADNGEAQKYKYRSVRIGGVPISLRAYLVLSRLAFDRKVVTMLYPTLMAGSADTLQGDHRGSIMLQGFHRLAAVGRVYGPLECFDLMHWSPDWMIPAVPDPPSEYFTFLGSAVDRIICGFQQGMVRVYRADGSIEATIPCDHYSRVPRYVQLAGDILVVDEASRFGPERYLCIYDYPSGSLRGCITPGMETVAILPGNGEWIWIGNTGAQGRLLFLDIVQNTSWEPQGLALTRIRSATPGSLKDVFLASADGIEWFRPQELSLTLLPCALLPHHLSYDEDNDLILASEGNVLHLVSYIHGEVVGSISMKDSIYEAWPWYNR